MDSRQRSNGGSIEAEVAIVGAGLAGLVAARRIAAAGKQPIVVEARDRVGGRLLNEEIGDGKVVEVGGQWIGPTQERIAALARELGIETFPTYDEGRHLIEIGGKLASYSGPITGASIGLLRDLSRAISPLALVDFEQARARLDRMARSVPLEEPWLAPKALEWDGQTFATWVRRNTRTTAAGSLFELACEAVWAAEPSDVSLLHVLFYTRSGSGFNTLVGTDGGAQQDRFHGGSQRLALAMAEQLGEQARAPGGTGAADQARSRGSRPASRRSRRRARWDDPASASRDRHRPAHPRRPHRLRPAVAGDARPTHPAHAAGRGEQDDGDL